MDLAFQCRSCGSTRGTLILDLGTEPLANNLLRPEDLSKAEPKFPLRLAVCESCWLLQILDLVPPVQLFAEYLYFSSFSDLMLRHAQAAAASCSDKARRRVWGSEIRCAHGPLQYPSSWRGPLRSCASV